MSNWHVLYTYISSLISNKYSPDLHSIWICDTQLKQKQNKGNNFTHTLQINNVSSVGTILTLAVNEYTLSDSAAKTLIYCIPVLGSTYRYCFVYWYSFYVYWHCFLNTSFVFCIPVLFLCTSIAFCLLVLFTRFITNRCIFKLTLITCYINTIL